MLLSDFSQDPPWWQRGVTCQISPRSFQDTNGDGIGEVRNELPRWVKYYNEQGKGLHMPFNFRLISRA